jgi:hypothetical protein
MDMTVEPAARGVAIIAAQAFTCLPRACLVTPRRHGWRTGGIGQWDKN